MNIENQNLLTEILESAPHYNGSDDAIYHAYFDKLIRLEAAIRAQHGTRQGNATDPFKEREFTKALLNDPHHNGYTLDDLLDEAEHLKEKKRQFVRRLLRHENGARLNADLAGIVVVEADLVYIAPGLSLTIPNNGNATFKPHEIRPRTEDMILWLTDAGTKIAEKPIHLSDIIHHKGKVRPEQMRTAPYTILEILPWKLKIAVCDEVGETTFFFPNEISNAEIALHTKTELIEDFGALDIRMDNNWQGKLGQYITAHLTQDNFTLATAHEIALRKNQALQNREPVTDRMRQELLLHVKRTHQGASVIFNTMPNRPEGLTRKIISNLITSNPDGSPKVKTVNPLYPAKILEYLKKQSLIINLDDESDLKGHSWRDVLLMESERTNMVARKIFKTMPDPPEGLTETMLVNWIYDNCQTANFDFYQKTRAHLEAQLTIVDLNKEDRREILIFHSKRTGIAATSIFHSLKDRGVWPDDLTESVLSNAFYRKRKDGSYYLKEDHYNLILDFLVKQHDEFRVDQFGRRELFISYMKKTELTAASIISGLKKEGRCSNKWNAGKIESWIHEQKEGGYDARSTDPKLYFEGLDYMTQQLLKGSLQPIPGFI